MRNVIVKGFFATVAGSLLGVWFLWQQERDEHLFKMYDCAHSADKVELSLEEAYIRCEMEAR